MRRQAPTPSRNVGFPTTLIFRLKTSGALARSATPRLIITVRTAARTAIVEGTPTRATNLKVRGRQSIQQPMADTAIKATVQAPCSLIVFRPTDMVTVAEEQVNIILTRRTMAPAISKGR